MKLDIKIFLDTDSVYLYFSVKIHHHWSEISGPSEANQNLMASRWNHLEKS